MSISVPDSIRRAWDTYRAGKQTEQELRELIDGGTREDLWMTAVAPPAWFLVELMEIFGWEDKFAR